MTPSRRIAVLLAVLAVALGWATLVPATARAACAFSLDDPQLTSRADVIFAGTLVRDEPAQLGAQRALTFRVTSVYKGHAYAEQRVLTDAQSSDALRLTPPGPFVVFATGAGAPSAPVAELTADGCGGTRAGAAPAALGAGQPPTAGSSRGKRSPGRSVAFIGGGILIIIGSVYYARRGGRRTSS